MFLDHLTLLIRVLELLLGLWVLVKTIVVILLRWHSLFDYSQIMMHWLDRPKIIMSGIMSI